MDDTAPKEALLWRKFESRFVGKNSAVLNTVTMV